MDFDYDTIPSGYYDDVFHQRKGAQSKWHHLKFDRVRREFSAGMNHLDVACGPGTFIGTLPETITSTGVDLAKPQIDYANKRYMQPNRTFITMEPGQLPLPDNTFDIITIIELIEHITEDEAGRLLIECARVLKPGGKLILTTPNYASLWPIIELGLNRFGRVSYEDQHITKYNRKKLRSLLAKTGLQITDVCAFQLFAPFYGALSWRLADWVCKLEPEFITRRTGNLLLGIIKKT